MYKQIYLLPLGTIYQEMLEVLGDGLAETFCFPTKVLSPIMPPASAYDLARRQYQSGDILRFVLGNAPADTLKILGIVEYDLFVPVFTFVYGEAQFGGKAALTSISRLRPEFYGAKPDANLVLARLLKQSYHEMAHTFGLDHCTNKHCIMYLANTIMEIDIKTDEFCADCNQMLIEKIREESK